MRTWDSLHQAKFCKNKSRIPLFGQTYTKKYQFFSHFKCIPTLKHQRLFIFNVIVSRQQLLAAVFDHLPLRTMSCRVHFPSSVSGPSRMEVLQPGTAFQITFVASPHLQPSNWKRFYSLKFLTLPRTFNIVMSAGHLCKWTQNRRRWRWWWWW